MQFGATMKHAATRVQEHLLVGSCYDYLFLALLAFLPWAVAAENNILRTQTTATVMVNPHIACIAISENDKECSPDKTASIDGYIHRKNWTFLTFELPIALLILRRSASRLFHLPFHMPKWILRHLRIRPFTIPDLISKGPVNKRKQFRKIALERKNFAIAVSMDILIHCIDMRDAISIYMKMSPVWSRIAPVAHVIRWRLSSLHWYGCAYNHAVHNHLTHRIAYFFFSPVPISPWDWEFYFLSQPLSAGYTHYWGNLLLIITAYCCQFLIVLFAMSLLVILVRHNRYFLKSIFVRSRRNGRAAKDSIVLEFDDPNRRLGLGKLAPQFNLQILLLILAALLTLMSRYNNSDTSNITEYLSGSNAIGSSPGQSCSSNPKGLAIGDFVNPVKVLLGAPYHVKDLFPNDSQKLFPIAWLGMFLIVMMPAMAKCLPLYHSKKRKAGIIGFLSEFLPPEQSLPNPATDGQITALAQRFACQSFWPVGDASAEALSIVCFFFFAVMVVPIKPTTIPQNLYLGEVLVVAYTLSKSLFWILGYVLSIVDQRLVSRQ